VETVVIKKGHDRRVNQGHIWIFSNELVNIPQLSPGIIVEVKNSWNRSLGYGIYNPNSLIAVRLLLTDQPIDTEFFIKRIEAAKSLRDKLRINSEMYRLVFGESDLLPGLIIDKYKDYFTMQILSAGMELLKNEIIEALLKIFPDTLGIIEKSTSKFRELEGLPNIEAVIYGTVPEEVVIMENEIKYSINLTGGQKTGFYLDQRDNRAFVGKISKDLSVLDCYTNQGGFALNTAMGGASKITGLDASENAVNSAKNNAALNSMKNVDFITADVPDYLEKATAEELKWDMVILDPPAFVKSRKNLPTAIKGYYKINRLALNLINDGGFLATSSCSQLVDENTFQEIISNAALKANKRLVLIYHGGQPSDHPVLPIMPETRYLKFFVFRVM
jgi:23S rRNA (cytosine1962-C5)-methyltransferase